MTSDPVTDSAVVSQKPHLDCFCNSNCGFGLTWWGCLFWYFYVLLLLDFGFAASDRPLLFFRDDMSACISCGGLFSTLILLKNFAMLCRFVFVDFENTCFL